MTIKLMRDCRPETNTVFWAAPFGAKVLADGEPFDFDAFFSRGHRPDLHRASDIKVLRADQVYGKGDVAETAWHGISWPRSFSSTSPPVRATWQRSSRSPWPSASASWCSPRTPRTSRRTCAGTSATSIRQRLAVDAAAERRARQGAARHHGAAVHGDDPDADAQRRMTRVPGEVVIADREFVMVLTDDRGAWY